MKRLYLLACCICLTVFHLSLSAQLLYQISGNGARAKSYLFATNALVAPEFLDTIPKTYAAFSTCNKVITEFAIQDYQAIAALRTAALLPDSVRLSDFYTDEEYQELSEALSLQIGLPMSQLARMKPAYLQGLFRDALFAQWLGSTPEASVETFFQNIALTKDIPVYALDDTGEALYMLFDREPFQWQCEELLKMTRYPEREIRQARQLKALYLNGFINEITYAIEAPDNKASISYSDYKIWTDRNRGWVKRLQPYLQDGRAFITLKAEYLGGDDGLIAQLRAAGYKLKPIRHTQVQ